MCELFLLYCIKSFKDDRVSPISPTCLHFKIENAYYNNYYFKIQSIENPYALYFVTNLFFEILLSQRSCDNEVRARSEDLPTERVRKGVIRVRGFQRETCPKF